MSEAAVELVRDSLRAWRRTGRESAVGVERDDAIVYELRDGLIARIDYYNDRSAALRAAELPAR